MKRLFTLSLALLVAMGTQAQVAKVSRNLDKQNVATMQKSTGMETLDYVQSEPNMTRTDGELDYTTYDWQSNDGARTWTIAWEDGKISFAHTYASTTSYTDRGTAIGTYDAVNDVWTPMGSRVEDEKTGFGSIARYGNNGIVVAAHTSSQCGVYIIEDKDNITPGTVGAVSYLPTAYDACWPSVMTSGANRDIIHVMATANEATIDGMTDPLLYFRSVDGGHTWEVADCILPFLGPDYGIDWTSNCCYWMETTDSNRLALVINNAWSDGMVIYSDDNGQTWERKVFYSHPNITGDFTDTWFFYPRWTSCQWDNTGKLHIAYEFNATTGAPGSGSYYPGVGGVAYWNETMPYNAAGNTVSAIPGNLTPGEPFVMDSAYMFSDIYASWWLWSDATHNMWPEYIGYLAPLDAEGNPEVDPYSATEFNIEDRNLHGSYNSGICAMPVMCIDPASNDIVVIWSAMDENNTDDVANYYYKLFARASFDGGQTWSTMKQLTTDFMYTISEFVYSQAVVRNGQLIIASQTDSSTGTYVQGDEGDPDDCYYAGLTFDINELFAGEGSWKVNEQEEATIMVYPNPVVDNMSFTLTNNQNVEIFNIMGQKVMSVEGHAGVNNVNVSSLNSGVYFLQAGSRSERFVVK